MEFNPVYRRLFAEVGRPGRAGLLLALTFCLAPLAEGQSYTVLHSFDCEPTDGALSLSGLIRDASGNLYGTTEGGGTYNFGTVFKLSSNGTEIVLHSFVGPPNDGLDPGYTTLVRDSEGNLYGTTENGGVQDNGTAYKVTPAGVETVLHSFGTLHGDPSLPDGGLLAGPNRQLYGTSFEGGLGYGAVYELFPGGAAYPLYDFQGVNEGDGSFPVSTPVWGPDGNLYGTTELGGLYAGVGDGGGTVFSVKPTGGETAVIHSFGSGTDGLYPYAGLVAGSNGNFYGTTGYGGESGNGTVFEVNTKGKEKVLYSFAGSPDGATPIAAVIRDKLGNLYGGTHYGGSDACFDGVTYGCGVLFKVTLDGKETILYSFGGAPDGANPSGPLLLDGGSLYGTTYLGGAYGCGTVFKYTP